MNDHHVYDWIDEASIPEGTKIETSRWFDDIKPRDDDETNVRSRIVVQQYNVVKQSAEDVACVGYEQRSASSKGGNLGRQRGVLSFSDA